MSEIHLILIKNNKIIYIKDHYKNIKRVLINNKTDNLRSEDVDAGYILLDLDRKYLINRQNAFSLKLEDINTLELI